MKTKATQTTKHTKRPPIRQIIREHTIPIEDLLADADLIEWNDGHVQIEFHIRDPKELRAAWKYYERSVEDRARM